MRNINKILIVVLLLLSNTKIFSQKIACPLKKLELLKNNTRLDFYSEPMLGISFKSPNDSIYSIYDGVITKNKMFRKNKHSITIKSRNKTEVIYFFVKETKLKVGDQITHGQLIGILGAEKNTDYFILSIMVRKNKILIEQKEYSKIFYKCLPKTFSLQ